MQCLRRIPVNPATALKHPQAAIRKAVIRRAPAEHSISRSANNNVIMFEAAANAAASIFQFNS